MSRLTTTVSTKGQVILPKAIRELRGWGPGTKLLVQYTPEGVLLSEAAAPARDEAGRRAEEEGMGGMRETPAPWSGPGDEDDADIILPKRPGGLAKWLRENPTPVHARRSPEEIEAAIREERESWD
jgi:AbrB family looped-hinge helix DNA binding protein